MTVLLFASAIAFSLVAGILFGFSTFVIAL